MLPYNKKLASNAKTLRKNMTSEEEKLWFSFLKRLPFRVKRQFTIKNYIVDFYISSQRTVIEIDGRQHLTKEHIEKDAIRDYELASLGINVLRYSNQSINNIFNAVINDILKNLELSFNDLKPNE